MLKVETYIGPSSIDGMGLFAKKDIPEGTVVWRYEEGYDLALTTEEFNRLTKEEQDFVLHAMYFSHEQNTLIFMQGDAIYCNHSDNANTSCAPNDIGEIEELSVANHDIKTGEEITCNYNEIGEVAWSKPK